MLSVATVVVKASLGVPMSFIATTSLLLSRRCKHMFRTVPVFLTPVREACFVAGVLHKPVEAYHDSNPRGRSCALATMHVSWQSPMRSEM